MQSNVLFSISKALQFGISSLYEMRIIFPFSNPLSMMSIKFVNSLRQGLSLTCVCTACSMISAGASGQYCSSGGSSSNNNINKNPWLFKMSSIPQGMFCLAGELY